MPMNKIKTYNVAVVGATGAVGREMVRMLEEREFPVKSISLLASKQSKGKSLSFKGQTVPVGILSQDSLPDADVALLSAGASISKEYSPLFAKKGVFVIDNSSAWRMDPEVPLVVPEVNPESLSSDKKIIANPNCSTIQMVLALKPLHEAVRIKSVRVATYQSVSGAGARGIRDLEEQIRAWAQNRDLPKSEKLPQQIAFNVIPHIDDFIDSGYTKEEAKLENETKKILGDPSMVVSATCVRVPVFRAHSEAVWIETEKAISITDATALLRKSPGISIVDKPVDSSYPMPIHASGKFETFVGRIRKDNTSPTGLVLWIVSDNLLKGAALNAVQIAETLAQRNII